MSPLFGVRAAAFGIAAFLVTVDCPASGGKPRSEDHGSLKVKRPLEARPGTAGEISASG